MNEASRKRAQYLDSLEPDPPKKPEPVRSVGRSTTIIQGDKLPAVKLINLILAQVCVHIEEDRKDAALDLCTSLIQTLNGEEPAAEPSRQ